MPSCQQLNPGRRTARSTEIFSLDTSFHLAGEKDTPATSNILIFSSKFPAPPVDGREWSADHARDELAPVAASSSVPPLVYAPSRENVRSWIDGRTTRRRLARHSRGVVKNKGLCSAKFHGEAIETATGTGGAVLATGARSIVARRRKGEA